jgi:hypothetical protein
VCSLYENKLSNCIALDSLIDVIPRGMADARRVLFELRCARQALVCARDSQTVLDTVKTTIMHVLSPADLVRDVKRLILDIPSKSYVTLFAAFAVTYWRSSEQPKRAPPLDRRLQQLGASNSNWRLRVGMIELLVHVLTHSSDAAAGRQVIAGDGAATNLSPLLSL